jgi:MFS family permease
MVNQSARSAVTRQRRYSVSRRTGFWLIAYLFVASMLGNTLPTPLYVIYQSQWLFSSGVITLVFAAYAAGALAALLLAGRAADQVGRRPVLLAAIGLNAVSSLAFIFASSLGWLFAGRVLSGLSAGIVTGTATATLADMAGPALLRRASIVATVATTGGLGLGPLLAGSLAEFAPNPTVLVFQVHLVLLAFAALALAVVPETVPSPSRLVLRFAGFRIPQLGRREFVAAGATGFAALALMGLFTALAPSFLGGVLHVTRPTIGGLVVFLLFGASTVTQIVVGRYPSHLNMRLGLGLFVLALALVVAALQQASLTFFLAATLVAGVAVGATFIGSLATANRLAPQEIRGQVVSTYFTFAYLGLTVPVIAVGFAADLIGFLGAVLACSVGLAVVCMFALVLAGRARPVSEVARSEVQSRTRFK